LRKTFPLISPSPGAMSGTGLRDGKEKKKTEKKTLRRQKRKGVTHAQERADSEMWSEI